MREWSILIVFWHHGCTYIRIPSGWKRFLDILIAFCPNVGAFIVYKARRLVCVLKVPITNLMQLVSHLLMCWKYAIFMTFEHVRILFLVFQSIADLIVWIPLKTVEECPGARFMNWKQTEKNNCWRKLLKSLSWAEVYQQRTLKLFSYHFRTFSRYCMDNTTPIIIERVKSERTVPVQLYVWEANAIQFKSTYYISWDFPPWLKLSPKHPGVRRVKHYI